MLFFINTFCFTYNPRNVSENNRPNEIPFITWNFQDGALLTINDCIETGEDCLIEKSLDMGASWMTLLVFFWRWMFKEMESFKMISMTEDEVDKAEDPDCLFWKIDYLLKMQPRWMNPQLLRNHLMLTNQERGNTILGDSTTGDAGRGGRKTAMLMDEFASVKDGEKIETATADVTKCRIFNSTPKGTANEFYRKRQQIAGNPAACKLIRLHWTVHPEKARGLKIVDGKPTSPWYEQQKARRSAMKVAQELDIDYRGSDYVYFDAAVVDGHIAKYVRAPMYVGELEFDKRSLEPLGFRPQKGGRLRIWAPLNGRGFLTEDEDGVVSADIATGTGASNSVISGGSRKLLSKIFEFASSHVRPDDLADYAVALCKWMKGPMSRTAKLIWEANGPGTQFTQRIKSLGFRNVYMRKNELSFIERATEIPGWWSDPKTKNMLLEEYYEALKAQKFVNPSQEALDECRCYIHLVTGEIVHSSSNASIDPTGARANHGDRVIADALLWHELKINIAALPELTQIPQACYAFRRQQALIRDRRKTESYWTRKR